MTRTKAYFVGIHPSIYRAGEPAEIVGVDICKPENGSERLCYHLVWSDFTEDWFPVESKNDYKIISFSDILNGNIPEVL